VHGEYTISRVHLVLQRPPEFEDLVFVQSERLTGVVERPKTREVKIKVDFANPPTKDAWADYDRDSFEVIPESVTLTGPSSDVMDASLTVVVNPKEAEQSGVVQVPLSIPRNLTSNPHLDAVNVRPVRRERQAYVNVNFVGHLPPGYAVAGWYVATNPEKSCTTPIRGPSGIVDKTSAIETSVVISGLTKGFTFVAKPTMPRQLQLVDSPLQIRVDVMKTHK
jgi:hypothetical protein